jgi:uncharacterized lipoprotein YmbA
MFTPQRDSTIFYTLGTHRGTATAGGDGSASKAFVINLFLDEIPQYADCPYIVTKAKGRQIIFSKVERWAEPFGDGCTRAIYDRLSGALDSAMIVSSAHAIGSTITCDHRIVIDFDDLIYNEDEGGIVVKCNWMMFSYGKGKQVLADKHVGFVPIGEQPSYEEVVRAMGQALEGVADDIADRVRTFFDDETQSAASDRH